MTDKINRVPPKRVKTEPPTEVHDRSGSVTPEHKKMERMADKLAHKGNKDQEKGIEHEKFSNF